MYGSKNLRSLPGEKVGPNTLFGRAGIEGSEIELRLIELAHIIAKIMAKNRYPFFAVWCVLFLNRVNDPSEDSSLLLSVSTDSTLSDILHTFP